MRIAFLLTWAYGMGGLVRTTVNTANHFAELGHDVELISFYRHQDQPFFPIHPDVTVTPLLDIRKSATFGRLETWERARPSRLTPRSEPFYDSVTLRGDHMVARALRGLDADVLISTRPAWNIAAAMWAPKGTVLIGQDHLNFTKHKRELRAQMKRWYPRLDAMVTLTEADRSDYQQLLKDAPTRVLAIGNAVSGGEHPRTAQSEPVVVTAGRFTHQKRYDHLVRAFAQVVEQRPDWTLRLFGDGPHLKRLRELVSELGMADNIAFMGRTSDTEGEFAKASVMAMSSRYEGFPMVILEAFACGLPVVSYDCPRGPGEMITSGTDGLLVDDGDVDALAGALLSLVNDPELRRTMSRNALATAERNSIEVVGAQWEQLFAELRADRHRRPPWPYRDAVTWRARRLARRIRRNRIKWS